jgi:hypothetical protein
MLLIVTLPFAALVKVQLTGVSGPIEEKQS